MVDQQNETMAKYTPPNAVPAPLSWFHLLCQPLYIVALLMLTPQGSPLSPILFLFFNADLVQRQIDALGRAVALIDDFTAWITGPTAQSNRKGTEAIIEHALK